MAWITFGTQTSPEAMSKLDTQFSNVGQWSIVYCTNSGTTLYSLTVGLSGYTAPAYANGATYSFIATSTSTGAVTLKIAALAALKVYKVDGTTQVTTGDIVSGYAYTVTYNAALDSAAGGWLLTSLGGLTETGIVLAANTTNNVSTTRHGFAPVLPNDASKFLDGTGAYSTPSGASSGAVINSISSSYATNAALSTALPYDDTIPQNTEGTEIQTASLTPSNASNKIRVRFTGQISGDTITAPASIALFQDATANALAATTVIIMGVGFALTIALEYEFTAGSTSATTLKIRAGGSAGTNVYFNGTNAARLFGGVSHALLVVEEIKA